MSNWIEYKTIYRFCREICPMADKEIQKIFIRLGRPWAGKDMDVWEGMWEDIMIAANEILDESQELKEDLL